MRLSKESFEKIKPSKAWYAITLKDTQRRKYGQGKKRHCNTCQRARSTAANPTGLHAKTFSMSSKKSL